MTTPFSTVTSTSDGLSHMTLRSTSSWISCRISSSERTNARTRSGVTPVVVREGRGALSVLGL